MSTTRASRLLRRTAGPAGIPCASESVTSSALVAPRLPLLSGGRDCWPRGQLNQPTPLRAKKRGVRQSFRRTLHAGRRGPRPTVEGCACPNALEPHAAAPARTRCDHEPRDGAGEHSSFEVCRRRRAAQADLPLETGYGGALIDPLAPDPWPNPGPNVPDTGRSAIRRRFCRAPRFVSGMRVCGPASFYVVLVGAASQAEGRGFDPRRPLHKKAPLRRGFLRVGVGRSVPV